MADESPKGDDLRVQRFAESAQQGPLGAPVSHVRLHRGGLTLDERTDVHRLRDCGPVGG